MDSNAGTSAAMLSRAVGTAIVASQENVSAPRATRARLAASVRRTLAPTPASLNQSALGTRAAARTGDAMAKEAAQSASVALSTPTAPLVCIPSMEVSTTEGSVRTMEALQNGLQWMVLFSVAPHLAPSGQTRLRWHHPHLRPRCGVRLSVETTGPGIHPRTRAGSWQVRLIPASGERSKLDSLQR